MASRTSYTKLAVFLMGYFLTMSTRECYGFTISSPTPLTTTTTCSARRKLSLDPLPMASYGRSSPVSGRDRSKRQERVGHVVRTEIASIIQLGYQIKNGQGYIDDDLRRRINVVSADVSPDLRQARITVSIIKPSKGRQMMEMEEEEMEFDDEEEYDDEDDDDDEYDEEYDENQPKQVFPVSKSGDAVMDRRRAYSWLVKNTKQIRHALSQRLKHMKSIPNLTFVQADVGAAVDVMNLIEKVSSGDYKRESLGMFGGEDDNLPEGMYLESELEGDGWIDDEYDDFEWDEEEDEEEEEEEKEKEKPVKNNKKK